MKDTPQTKEYMRGLAAGNAALLNGVDLDKQVQASGYHGRRHLLECITQEHNDWIDGYLAGYGVDDK